MYLWPVSEVVVNLLYRMKTLWVVLPLTTVVVFVTYARSHKEY